MFVFSKLPQGNNNSAANSCLDKYIFGVNLLHGSLELGTWPQCFGSLAFFGLMRPPVIAIKFFRVLNLFSENSLFRCRWSSTSYSTGSWTGEP